MSDMVGVNLLEKITDLDINTGTIFYKDAPHEILEKIIEKELNF